MSSEQQTVLQVQKINTYYGLSHILYDVSLEIKDGEILCLLGRNGAGKTTAMRSISGLTPPKSGSIYFLGEDVARMPAHLIARKGIRTAFSDKRVLGDLTVRENLNISRDRSLIDQNKTSWDFDGIYQLFPVLKRYEKRWARSLSGGEQQMLCVASALMGNPKLLLLDEPTIGLSPVIVQIMGDQIRKLRDEGICILLTEQNVKFAMSVGDRCYILDVGEIRFHGDFEELSKDEYVVRTYLAV